MAWVSVLQFCICTLAGKGAHVSVRVCMHKCVHVCVGACARMFEACFSEHLGTYVRALSPLFKLTFMLQKEIIIQLLPLVCLILSAVSTSHYFYDDLHKIIKQPSLPTSYQDIATNTVPDCKYVVGNEKICYLNFN